MTMALRVARSFLNKTTFFEPVSEKDKTEHVTVSVKKKPPRKKMTPKYSPGDIKVDYKAQPRIKPPRRKRRVQNETGRMDTPKNDMQDYRDKGKDYQKQPEILKELHRKQKEHLKRI